MSKNLPAPTTVKGMLASPAVEAQIKNALPKHMDAKRMLRMAMSAVSTNPKLAMCTPNSVGIALIKAAECGVEPNGWEAHLVPYKNKGVYEAQLIIDYKGLAKLAYQSELVTEIHAEVVREGDTFEWMKGTENYLRWKPSEGKPGPMKYAWASAKIKNGGCPFIVMTREEVMQHKACSQGSNSSYSPWNNPATEPSMWKKTAVRELAKLLPRSSSLTQLLIEETAHEIGGDVIEGVLVQPPQIEEAPPEETSKADALAEKAKAKQQARKKAEPPPEEPAAEPTLRDELTAKIRAASTMDELTEVSNAITNHPRKAELTDDDSEVLVHEISSKQVSLEE